MKLAKGVNGAMDAKDLADLVGAVARGQVAPKGMALGAGGAAFQGGLAGLRRGGRGRAGGGVNAGPHQPGGGRGPAQPNQPVNPGGAGPQFRPDGDGRPPTDAPPARLDDRHDAANRSRCKDGTFCFTAGHQVVVGEVVAAEVKDHHYALAAGGVLCLSLAGARLVRRPDDEEVDAAMLPPDDQPWYADDLWDEFDPLPIVLPRSASRKAENAPATDDPDQCRSVPDRQPTVDATGRAAFGRRAGVPRPVGILLHPLPLALLGLLLTVPWLVRLNRTETRLAHEAIEQVTEFDRVLAREEHGEAVRLMPVAQAFGRTADHLRLLTVATASGTQVFETTDEHPFQARGRGWTDAEDLVPGDELVGPDGATAARVQSTGRIARPDGERVFNFEVTGHHTYFVRPPGARGPPVLVHNSDCPGKIQEFDVRPYGDFGDYTGDGLTGHELLQSAWLRRHANATRSSGFGGMNPAIALTDKGHHGKISKLQREYGLH